MMLREKFLYLNIQRSVVLPLMMLLLVPNVYSSSPVFRTINGPVEGVEQISSLGKPYYAFRGIPYAEPPITGIDHYTGEEVDRRFKAPIPLQRSWSGNLRVHNFRDFCIPSSYSIDNSSSLSMAPKTSENCLFVNVYTPAGGAKRKTVLVYIHGGAFVTGNPNDMKFGPDFLLSEDNIVVTVQYRVGIFGFLNLGFGEYTGNMGLKDQQLALKWVYENIESFSGNKDEILLFGESAGGASVGFHLLNEESRRYFNRAYLSSSSAFSHYALREANHLRGMKDFTKISADEELIGYLRTANSDFLSKHYPFTYGKSLTPPWVPTIEHTNAVRPFITKTPDEIYGSGEAQAIDIMFSFNSKEGVAFRPDLLESKEPLIKEDWEESELEIPFENFNRTTHPEKYKRSLEKLRDVYYPDPTNVRAIESENIDILSDMIFNDGVLKAVVLQAKANNDGIDESAHRGTFLFRFSVDAGLNLFKLRNQVEFEGATHGDELCYIFHCHELDHLKVYDNHLEQKDATFDTIMRMVKIVTNFARTGNPSIEDDTPFRSCTSPNDIFCQEISNDPKSSVTTNIKEQLHYDTWREIEEIHKESTIPQEFQGM